VWGETEMNYYKKIGILFIITGTIGSGYALYRLSGYINTGDIIGSILTIFLSTVYLFGFIPLGVGAISKSNRTNGEQQ
jgi:hypothetical protein